MRWGADGFSMLAVVERCGRFDEDDLLTIVKRVAEPDWGVEWFPWSDELGEIVAALRSGSVASFYDNRIAGYEKRVPESKASGRTKETA